MNFTLIRQMAKVLATLNHWRSRYKSHIQDKGKREMGGELDKLVTQERIIGRFFLYFKVQKIESSVTLRSSQSGKLDTQT